MRRKQPSHRHQPLPGFHKSELAADHPASARENYIRVRFTTVRQTVAAALVAVEESPDIEGQGGR